MTTISDRDRAEVQAMLEAFYGGGTLAALNDDAVPWWLAVRDHVLAAHECPTVPVWRPTTRDEIQAGWEVRARYSSGTEARWGTAHHRGSDGDWRTEAGTVLTWDDMGWTCETTAPLPAPEPWPDGLVTATANTVAKHIAAYMDADEDEGDVARAILDHLAERGLIERPKAGER